MSAAGGNLRVVHINTAAGGGPGSNGAPLLEFVVHNGQGEWDKAPDGGLLPLCSLSRQAARGTLKCSPADVHNPIDYFTQNRAADSI